MEQNQKKDPTVELARQFLSVIGSGEVSIEKVREREEQTANLMCYYRCALLEVETKFRVLNEEFSLQYDRNPINTIKTRIKSPRSIVEKMQRKNIPMTLENMEAQLNDVAGVRVVCSFIDDVYLLADCLRRQDDVRILQTKDYIRYPKENGYRSLHMIIETPIYLQSGKRNMKVEIQLRTIAMEFWSELEHKLRYKKDIDPDTQKRIADELTLCASMSAETDLRMQAIRDELGKWEKEVER